MFNSVPSTILIAATTLGLSAGAAPIAPTVYVMTVTNGSAMPLSPIVFYVQDGQAPKAQIGEAPSPGFTELCQMGNPKTRIQELGAKPDVTYKTETTSMLAPGESRTVEIEVRDPLLQSIQFETMYGKTKNLCGVAGVTSHGLYALKQHVTSSVIGKDNVLQTGAFLDPSLPVGQTYLDPQACGGIPDAVTCLRSLALTNPGPQKVHFFSGYLSSLTMLLETKYGASETLNLMIPTSGAIHFEVKLKH